MSSRALRKLGKRNDILALSNIPDQEDEECLTIEEEATFSSEQKQNKFSLLLGDGEGSEKDSGTEDDLKIQDNDTMEKVLTDSTNQVKQRNSKEENELKTGNKKKRKRNRKKKLPKEEVERSKSPSHSEDEVDKSIREVNEMLGISSLGGGTSSNASVELSCKALLAVEHRHLNTENEMRRKFGSNVIAGDRRRNTHGRTPARSSWLVPQRPNWQPVSKSGITMNLLENNDGLYHFAFEHSPAYQEIQFKFLDAVDSLDQNNIVALLNAHPNHIDSILQLSEICKINEDHQMAAELIERALFVYERSFHTLFSVSRANCRIDYRRAENRSFFLALFRHMIYIGERACYRTSLEFCKLILSLDPEDQLAILLLIDFYAIKSEEYDFLLKMYQEWKDTKNLLQLPNFSFSVPLAMFHSQKHTNEEASRMLEDALIKFPTTLLLLMDKCGVMLSDELMNYPYFQRTNDLKQSDGLNRLISLYIGRSFMLWKEPEVLDWLAECAKNAMKRIENRDPLCLQWEPLWKSLYQRVPLNIYRHIVISEIKEATRALPIDISNSVIRMYDPLPPEDSISGYKIPERPRQPAADNSLLSTFLRSLLPSYDMNQQANRENQQLQQRQQAPQGAEAANRPQLENEINGSARRLMGAMRELLNSMTYRPDLENDNEGQNIDQEWEDLD